MFPQVDKGVKLSATRALTPGSTTAKSTLFGSPNPTAKPTASTSKVIYSTPSHSEDADPADAQKGRSGGITSSMGRRFSFGFAGGKADSKADSKAGGKAGSKASVAEAQRNEIRAERRRWLDYWICFAGIWLIRLFVMRWWHSTTMLVCLWLQHSYFNGASKIVRSAPDVVSTMAERNRKSQIEREERKRIAATEVEKVDTGNDKCDRVERPTSGPSIELKTGSDAKADAKIVDASMKATVKEGNVADKEPKDMAESTSPSESISSKPEVSSVSKVSPSSTAVKVEKSGKKTASSDESDDYVTVESPSHKAGTKS